MRLVSFQVAGSTAIEVGVLVADEGVVSLHQALPTGLLAAHEGMPEVIARWSQLQPQVQALLNQAPHARLPEVHLLAPVPRPPKLLAIGLNYLEHVNENIVGDQGRESRSVPEHQLWFTKLGHAINGPFDDIVLPKVSERTDYEAELVAVIGQRCKHVPRERAHEVIFGYCVGNDVSVRDWQKRTSQWTLGKSFDTHAPFGPWLTTADELNGDPHALDLRCWVNGELRQNSNTRLMIHDVCGADRAAQPGDDAGAGRRDLHGHLQRRGRGLRSAEVPAPRRCRARGDREAGRHRGALRGRGLKPQPFKPDQTASPLRR